MTQLSGQNLAPTGFCNVCGSLTDVILSVHKDVSLLRCLSDDLAERQLRALSREVWIYLLTVLDRYVLILAISVGILTPFYLFVIIPPSPDVAIQP